MFRYITILLGTLFLFAEFNFVAPIPIDDCYTPGSTISRQYLAFGGSADYCLSELTPSSKYELRVSYWKTMTAKFILSFEPYELTVPKLPGHARFLKYVEDEPEEGMEKLEFETNEIGEIISDSLSPPLLPESVRFHVKVLSDGLSFARMNTTHGREEGGVWYNIRFDPILYGMIPRQSTPLLFLIPLCILAFIFLLVRLFNSNIFSLYNNVVVSEKKSV